MYTQFVGKGIDGSVFKIIVNNSVFIFKASNNKKQIEYEEYIHFNIYNKVNCKKYIVKPIEISKKTHKEIITLIGFKYGYAMEYIEGITLYEAIQLITNAQDYNIINKQLTEAYICLWKNGFIHGDSHMKNVIIYLSKQNSPKIKIIDFGFSISFSPPKEVITKNELLQWFKKRWSVILHKKRIKKGNPDSMYLNINFIPVYAEHHKNILKRIKSI